MQVQVRSAINQILRLFEKLPLVNLNQVIFVRGRYVVLAPKCGSRSIRDIWLAETGNQKGAEWGYIRYVSKRSLSELASQDDVCIFVRHPLSRLHSCWKQKVTFRRDKGLFYFFMYFPLLRPDMSFLDFITALARIPAPLSEKHFRPLSQTVDVQDANIKWFDISEISFQLNGAVECGPRSNTTEEIELSENEEACFYRLLRQRFDEDLAVYSRCRV